MGWIAETEKTVAILKSLYILTNSYSMHTAPSPRNGCQWQPGKLSFFQVLLTQRTCNFTADATDKTVSYITLKMFPR